MIRIILPGLVVALVFALYDKAGVRGRRLLLLIGAIGLLVLVAGLMWLTATTPPRHGRDWLAFTVLSGLSFFAGGCLWRRYKRLRENQS